ncbi:MAG: hypothetical protein V4689_21305 [Verrucomicrobiota bacterium]
MKKILVTNASWEPRYSLGVERLVKEGEFSKVVSLFCTEFDDRTHEERFQVRSVCSDSSVKFLEFGYPLFDSMEAWRRVSLTLVNEMDGAEVVIDISTMPRFLIWTILSLVKLQRDVVKSEVIYHKPGSYCGNWVSRDPMEPFLVPRFAGLTKLGAPTALLVVSGFDTERISHLISVFEPTEVLVGIQNGKQFQNEDRNQKVTKELLQEIPEADVFEIDSYQDDCGFGALEAAVAKVVLTHNVVATSLGPKPSALGLMKLNEVHEGIGLVYTPSREYNQDYSEGLGETLRYYV